MASAAESEAAVVVLADFIAGLRHGAIAETAVEHAKLLLLSTIASTACGLRHESARIVRADALKRSGGEQARIWFAAHGSVPIADAAFVNAVASDAGAADDADLRTLAHYGPSLCGAAPSLAAAVDASGHELLAAIVAGYEVAGRFADAARSRSDLHPSYFAPFAAATATAVLLHATPEQLVSAWSLAAIAGSGVRAASPTWARQFQAGAAAAGGVRAAVLAMRGYRVPASVVVGPGGAIDPGAGALDLTAISGSLGGCWGIADHLAIKLSEGGAPYAAAREAAAAAARAGAIEPGRVERVVVSGPWLRSLPGLVRPGNFDEATHSLAHAVAVAVIDRAVGWGQLDDTRLEDLDVRRIADRVVIGEPIAAAAGYAWSAMVRIELLDGTAVAHEIGAPHGSAPRGIDAHDVDAKAGRLLSDAGADDRTIAAILKTVHGLDADTTPDTLDAMLGVPLVAEEVRP